MEKKQATCLGLTVHKQRLRQRLTAPAPKQDPCRTAACSPSLHPCKHFPALPKGLVMPQNYAYGEVNWIKYNILVSIYQNWLRLEPFIRYWLAKTYQQPSLDDPKILSNFLRRAKENNLPQGKRKEKEEEVSAEVLEAMRLRREQLLRGMQPSDIDIEHLSRARHLAKQLLSTLPLENNKWSKIRIQRQNRLLDQMISNFNQEEFHMNSDAIIHSIKERLYFIDQMQKRFIDISQEQKDALQEKLELLKMPFKKVFNKANANKQPDILFQTLWQEIQSERSKLLNKKPQLRHSKRQKSRHRYAFLQKTGQNELIVEYHYKDEYSNEQYALNSNSRRPKNSSNTTPTVDDSLQVCKSAEATKDSVEVVDVEEVRSESESQGYEADQQALNAQLVQAFMRRQKQKPNYRQQTSNFFKKPAGSKLDTSYRPSISIVDGKSHKDTDLSQIRVGSSLLRERNSIMRRRDSLSANKHPQQIFEREDHVSRFRSYKKLVTSKNIGGNTRHTKVNNRELSRKDSQIVSLTKISSKLNRIQKRDFRSRDHNEVRKGVLHKKVNQRRDSTPEEEIPMTPEQLLILNRQEYIAYFNKILSAGHLDTDRHEELREQVKALVKKHQPSALQETKAYVHKLVEKSKDEHHSDIFAHNRHRILMELSAMARKDEGIRARLRDEIKMGIIEEKVEKRCSEDSICNEQIIYSTAELRKVSQELKRIVCFRNQAEGLSFAKRLLRNCNNLLQRTI